MSKERVTNKQLESYENSLLKFDEEVTQSTREIQEEQDRKASYKLSDMINENGYIGLA